MQQSTVLAERIGKLKAVAASMQEGAIHTEAIPEIDKILALPDHLEGRSVVELEAITRQLREYEQSFDSLGYTMLEQLMPSTGLAPVYRVARARDDFRRRLREMIGQRVEVPGLGERLVDQSLVAELSRYALSLGTPPVVDEMRALVSRVIFGRDVDRLADFVEVLDCDRVQLDRLLELLRVLVDASTHYCTAAEEQAFLREAGEFVNFEGGRLFNRVVITASPERVAQLIERHVFDKFGQQKLPPVELVERLDALDDDLIAAMEAEPNKVFVVKVTRIPHALFAARRTTRGDDGAWLRVLGRLILIDCSARAARSNTSIVYTLFPHVARTLRNVHNSFAGRPAGVQMQLRRALERFSADDLAAVRRAVERRLAALAKLGAVDAEIDEIRAQEWTRDNLFDYLTLVKLRRCVAFLEQVARDEDPTSEPRGGPPLGQLNQLVSARWMRYFYSGLPAEQYRATVVPGGGRGALTLFGEYHLRRTRRAAERFRREQLAACRARLEQLKSGLKIPASSTDEIEAAIRQSQLQALSPSQWRADAETTSRAEHLTRTALYRAAETAARVAQRTREGLDRAAYGNVTGAAAAQIKQEMSKRGFRALYGHLEEVFGRRVGAADRKVRDVLAPFQQRMRELQRAVADFKGEIDPVAVSEIEAVLNVIEQGHFYPTLILPEMGWTYAEVFPEKDYPPSCAIALPLNRHHEADPLALLARLEELRYLFRQFPEIFALYCETMLLVLNTPHNPTGVVYRRETVLKLLRLAAEYGVTVLDDNSYHKLLTKAHKDREGDRCVAEVYEANRSRFSEPVRLVTVGATTKALQGAGNRTGLLHSNVPEVVDYAAHHSSRQHYLSLYMTLLKLESGQEAKRFTREVERLAGELVDFTGAGAPPWARLKRLLAAELDRLEAEDFPVAVFETVLAGYERLLRLEQRGAMVQHLSAASSELLKQVKHLRLERRLRGDIQRRLDQTKLALLRAGSDGERDDPVPFIEPRGAFYCCVKLCEDGDTRGLQPFLEALAAARGVDVISAGKGYIRMSLGGRVAGDRASYDRLGLAIEVYARILRHYWRRFEEAGRAEAALGALFDRPMLGEPAAGTPPGEASLVSAIADLRPLLDAAASAPAPSTHNTTGGDPLPIEPSERGVAYCIEEGRSVADKVFIELGEVCDTVEEMLASRPFRVLHRRLLKKVFRRALPQSDLTFAQVENQYGPLACLAAYRDRQLIDETFRRLMRALYAEWHGVNTAKVLQAELAPSTTHAEKTSALRGINERLNQLINELMYAFGVPGEAITADNTFEVGFEALREIDAAEGLPRYLRQIISGTTFAGATCALDPAPSYTTGAVKRIGDYRYGFIRRDEREVDTDAQEGGQARRAAPRLDYFRRRLADLPRRETLADYVGKAVQVGPFKMLLLCHRSMFHLINDELRLFPQIEEVQLAANLQRLRWEGVLLFGVPAKLMGESYKTGYVIDRYDDGALLPTAWVAREDATDYVGFLKKSLLTLHNERVKLMGGMPVHGSMVTITFKNGLRKTIVLSADSGAGKSETVTAMMEQMVSGGRLASVLDRIDILAGDMLSLWRGGDGQLYAFGTETGDFMRLTDITETWQRQFGDLLKRGAFSNLHFKKNPRVTIPGICDRRKVLSPTRVNGFFYINNYEAPSPGRPPSGGAVELIEDPHQALKQVLVRGQRKNKGTSGDQPSLRAGLELAGEGALVVRFRYALDRLLEWRAVAIDGQRHTCLCFRDGAGDVWAAREVVGVAFRGRGVVLGGAQGEATVGRVDYDVMRNVFWLQVGRRRVVLDREVYDGIFEPLVSTFCGNPFVDPAGMDRTLETFAETMRRAKVHTGEIKTQLARAGYEHSGPQQAADDLVDFLLEDEEVNARFQRNRGTVREAIQQAYGGVLPPGTNLPTELEGENLLRLEEHESIHVAFIKDGCGAEGEGAEAVFDLPTPYYRYRPRTGVEAAAPFIPAIALPEQIETIADIGANPDHELPLDGMEIAPERYSGIYYWNGLEELAFQVLLSNGVINLGCSESELARFPYEVRKALRVATLLALQREPRIRHRRFPLRVELTCHDGDGASPGRSENISAKGIFVATNQPGDVGQRIEVELPLPEQPAPSRVACEVVWRRRPGEPGTHTPGMGLRFCEDYPVVQRTIEALASRGRPAHETQG